MNAIFRPAIATLGLALAFAPLVANAQTSSSPAPSAAAMKADAMHGDAMHGDAMKADAMHGDAMKGDAMHGDAMMKPSNPANAMKMSLAMAKNDLAMQKTMLAMSGVDAKTAALAKKRAADDADYIRLITIAMQAQHVGP